MQHGDRQALISQIGNIVEEIYGRSAGNDGEAALRHRLDALLDAFLLESQSIAGTEVTVLLADIRGFTALTQSVPPSTLILLLNAYFTAMCDVVQRHGGAVDKFMGDSVMAVFGAPQQRPDDLQRALACAVEMQQAMVELNRRNQSKGLPNLYAGIALNTGTAMAGSFGSDVHSEYTVIGDAVNLAARIESFSLRGQVLLSEATHWAAQHFIEVSRINQVQVKGMSKPLSLYELRSVRGPPRLVIPEIEVRRSPRIAVELDAIFRMVESQNIHAEQFIGRVNDMGYYGMRADLPMVLPTYSEVVINLRPELGGDAPGDVYARVLRTRPHGDGFRTSMEFTTVDTPGHRQVKAYIDDRLWRG
jgi:adenylate cyclase